MESLTDDRSARAVLTSSSLIRWGGRRKTTAGKPDDDGAGNSERAERRESDGIGTSRQTVSMPAAANRQSARSSHARRAGEQAEASRQTRAVKRGQGERKKKESKHAAGGSSSHPSSPHLRQPLMTSNTHEHSPPRWKTRRGKHQIAPRPSTRENGERSETTGKRAANRYGRATGWGNERTTPPLSMHHIDIADIMKQAARSLRRPDTISHGQGEQADTARSMTSPRSTTRRDGAGGEARQYDRRMTGHGITRRGQTETNRLN